MPDNSDLGLSTPGAIINEIGGTFSDEIEALTSSLSHLNNDEREEFRDRNAHAIAENSANRLLIVAGPGAGKSFLFMSRIKNWLPLKPDSSVYVSSFVRKLVIDLRSDVAEHIPDDQQCRVTVNTLHGLARSLLERAHGTQNLRLRPHMQIVSEVWSGMVWNDVLQFHPSLTQSRFTYRSQVSQLNREEPKEDTDWKSVRATATKLSHFYNALGFAEMIGLARDVVDERPELVTHDLWIIDEFQDFNRAEEHLIRSLTSSAEGVLVAGDDDQALYQTLKASTPDIIISYYEGGDYANAILPYCSRCSYHVCLAASSFIAESRAENAIEKVYLPLKVAPEDPKVQIVATSAPTAAVDYIKRFIENRQQELDDYIVKMQAGEESDPYLLILTPDKKINFYRTGGANEDLKTYLSQWKAISSGRSSDYRMIMEYCRISSDLSDNFALRKVLDHEGYSNDQVHEWLKYALRNECNLAEVPNVFIADCLAKCESVLNLAVDADLTAIELVENFGTLVSISNPTSLVEELEMHPIRLSLGSVDDDAEEEIQTAGALAPVELLSIVGSKGLSARHVIIIGCDDVNLSKTTNLAFYVGLTRARRSLHLIVSMKASGSTTAHPFVLALPGDHCEYIIYKKTGRVSERLANSSQLEDRIGQWQRMSRGQT
jgi:superfamily I DNA/RNA helicase